jgi:hypothetical protein
MSCEELSCAPAESETNISEAVSCVNPGALGFGPGGHDPQIWLSTLRKAVRRAVAASLFVFQLPTPLPEGLQSRDHVRHLTG